MNCPDKDIIKSIQENELSADYQAIRCLKKCYKQAVAVMGKLGGNQMADERDSAFNHAMAEFIIQVRKGKFELTGAAKICTYLTEIARRKWLEFSRKNRPAAPIPIPEQETDTNSELSDNIKAALELLSFSDRDILVAFYFYDLPLEEYANKKRITHDAAKQRISRARTRLKEKLKTILQ